MPPTVRTGRFLPAALLAAPAALAAQGPSAAPRAYQPSDNYRLHTVSAPAVSPDGKRVAFTVQTVREADNRYHREVWVVPTAGGTPTRFTSPSTESSNPSFTPDGKHLLFNSQRQGGRGSTWAIRLDEPSGEAFQIGWMPPASASWSNAGVAVWADTAQGAPGDSARAPMGEVRGGLAISRAPFGAITKPLDPKRFDGRHVVDFPYKSNDRGYTANRLEARRWRPAQVYVLAKGDTVKKQLTNAAYSHRDVKVSPDGRWIAFVADSALRPDSVVQWESDSLAKLPYDRVRDEAERNQSDIYVMPAAGGAPRKVATIAGGENQLEWSPDGKTLGFIHRPGRVKSARLATVDVASGRVRNLIGDFQYEPGGFDWLSNTELSMGAEVGGRTGFFRVRADGSGAPREVIGGRRRMTGFAWDPARRVVAYVATSHTKPTELYVANADGSGERRLTSFNDAVTRQVAFSDAERFTFKSVGDREIEGWLMKPYGYQAGKKYPAVLYIHGGPHSAYGEGWMDEFQNLAAAGMYVIFTNPRGSSGYGADFTYSTRGKWFDEDYQDLMKAVDIVAARPDVDSTRLGVTGGSYGGVMTAWVTVKTNRFKAAQTDRMISNWWSWYGSSDAQGLTEFEFFGKPWDNPALYDTLSPIRYIRQVKTPTLMVQSEEDFRTPMTDAEQWFLGLRKQGVPAELVRYPRSTHELSRSGEPWLLVDRLGRLRQWFGHWLVGPQAATTTANAGGGS
ncbi:S9 family peptidase [Roseisolibacter sp. H3M3-2]|uniref:S9 family peptidase n=1 Tax=Roseisolibacter sp. H3M3-2 TaxID=3031323 RepID=UPI0023DB2405|nr:S9 family peptidase [Roseisolibacter sp. H3M3-2]MDF1502108.1 S9 family peptidase [Roseisolibacter sp. H3M3-2]